MQLICSLETLKDKRKNTNFGLGFEIRLWKSLNPKSYNLTPI